MQRSLAMPGEDDGRARLLLGDEPVERLENVAIGEVERLCLGYPVPGLPALAGAETARR